MASCRGRVVYDAYAHTPTTGWEKNDSLVFSVPPVATAGTYRMSIGLRINDLYPFTALSLELRQTAGSHTYTDTLHCALADDGGKLVGRGVGYLQYMFRLRELELDEGDTVHVRLRHIMKREILPGVADVGVKITKK